MIRTAVIPLLLYSL